MMEESYEDIVRRWYRELRPRFINTLMDHYSKSRMRLEDAENIYQDVFLAVQENLKSGKVRENTVWSTYIMTIGLNMASKHYRRLGKETLVGETDKDAERQEEVGARLEALLQAFSKDDDSGIYGDPEAQAILGEELDHTPEPCASLIRYTYYSGLTDKEIMEELGRYNSTVVVRTRRWQCMQELVYRVKLSLYNAGIIDDKPERRKRNGK